MGVHGLWKLLEPSGEPVALETLENKVLAIDVSMWLHQVLKGYHDASGNALPNAHLLGLFHRICKLMFFRIKPVFVFDGGVPMLKQQTMINRKKQKKTAGRRAEEERLRLLRNMMEQDILQRIRGNTSGSALKKLPSRKNEVPSMFELPENEPDALKLLTEEEEESSDDDIEEIITWDNFDPNSTEFKRLPAMQRLEILNSLKDSRKQGSWRRIHEMPQESDDFSEFQMKRLLVRRSAQVEMDEAEKELSKSHTLTMDQIKEIMAEKGSLSTKLVELDVDYGRRIAADAVTRLIMISNSDTNVPKLAVEEDKTASFPEEPAIKVKEEPREPLSELVAENDKGEVSEIVISDDEMDRSMVEKTFISNIADEEDDSGLTQDEILALIMNGKSQSRQISDMENFNQPSTSKAHNDFSRQFVEEKTTPEQLLILGKKLSVENKTDGVVPQRSPLPSTSEKFASGDGRESLVIDNPVKNSFSIEAKQTELVEEISDESQSGSPKEAVFVDEASADKEPVLIIEEAEPSKTIEINVQPVVESKEEEDIFSEIFSEQNNESESVAASPASAIGIMSSTEESSEEMEKEEEAPKDDQEANETEDDALEPASEEKIDEPAAPRTDFRSMNFTEEEMKILEEKLAREQAAIVTEIGRQERISTNLSNQICNEAQELISLFGLPFVVAPMEAEAQCAMLDLLSLTNGTVTDDSDIWLFGGRTVYRNFFNQAKNVERYTSDSITKNFRLSRDRLILLAMLVGSDYTVGLQGVGPVTALEIIAEFSSNWQQEIGDPEELVQPLKKFREWWQSKEITNMRKKKLTNILKNLNFHEGFPSEAVVNAYVHPQVNDSKDTFKWEKPDIEGLIQFSGTKFGWTKSHAESVLDPVIKKLGETMVQGRIDSYFTAEKRSKDVDLLLSSRVRNAVGHLLGTASQNDTEGEDEPRPSTSTRPPKVARAEAPPKPKRGKKVSSNPSKLNDFKQQLTKKPKPLKAVDIELQPKKIANVPKKELIPQREKKNETALQSKLKAIEVFRKRKIDPISKPQRPKRVVAEDNYLSESSDSD